MTARVLVAGVGNIFHRDDGFGVAVVRALSAEALPPGVVVRDYGVRGLHLAYDIADGADLVVIVDTVPDAGGAGGVVVIDVSVDPGADRVAPGPVDAHGVHPDTVLRTVRTLGVDPPPTVVVGCQPASLADGIGLSSVVESAVGPAVQEVLRMVEDVSGPGGPEAALRARSTRDRTPHR